VTLADIPPLQYEKSTTRSAAYKCLFPINIEILQPCGAPMMHKCHFREVGSAYYFTMGGIGVLTRALSQKSNAQRIFERGSRRDAGKHGSTTMRSSFCGDAGAMSALGPGCVETGLR
jgi:hypothetical protein